MVKAASMALKEYPILNASIDSEAEMVTLRANHNIGVAMDTPVGLLVPSVKRVQDLTVLEVAEELNRLYELAIKGKLGEGDLKVMIR
jgi:2-oxoisovalerate dehydrogenase E2 component (dihydrolipoyl transacylase)